MSVFRKIFSEWSGRRSFALNYLDVKLKPYLNFKKGFFIEAGANDGVRQSNTLYFERYRGWHGLLIEPIPHLANKCKKNRPKAIVENCALVASDYPDSHIEMQYCDLMSMIKGALDVSIADEHMEKSRKALLKRGEDTYIISVPVCTLSALLDKHGIKKVDFLSLDVEGYEPEALKGIDFSRHRPRFMLIEVRDRQSIEEIIEPWYYPIAVLNTKSTYQDILYGLKEP
jgi:FkbM family methyltransferase